jgi:tripartite-type tricarboxylate transporter receptor subunit TctC
MRIFLAALFFLCSTAMAAHVVVGHPAGGVQDLIMRHHAKALEARGEKLIVENKLGAGSLLAIAHVAQQNRGLLVVGSNSIVSAPFFYNRLPFNVHTSFVPITYLGDTDNVLLAHPSVPAATVRQLIALAKQKEVSFGFGGFSTNSYIGMMQLLERGQAKMLSINSKSSFYVPMDVMRGDIDLTLLPTPTLVNSYRYAVDAGKLRLVATTGKERSLLFPNVPTVGETYKGYDSILWWGLFAHRDTAVAEVAKMKATFDWAGAQESKALAAAGVYVRNKTQQQFAVFLRDEQLEWQRLNNAIKFPRNDF